MPQASDPSITIIIPQEEEAWSALGKRLKQTSGEVLLILAGREQELIAHPDMRARFLKECIAVKDRLRVATKHPAIAAEMRGVAIRVLDRTKQVKLLLHGHPRQHDALRVFSPQLWRQQLTSRMQRMGLLSMPKLRIFSLAGLSLLLFYVVVFQLLPSSEIVIRPRQEAVSQTVNVLLVQSGAVVDGSDNVRRIQLVPITVRYSKSMMVERISQEFIGTSAEVALTVINKSGELYDLRQGTRFTNQAGMVFRIQSPAIVEPGEEVTVRAIADDTDLYGQIIGERGNVPAGLRWDIPGLSVEERTLVYGENRAAGKNGTTAYRSVLRPEDLDIARRRLEQELMNAAKERVLAQRDQRNDAKDKNLILLDYAELTTISYENVTLPQELLGQVVESVPVEGTIVYTMYAYDAGTILDFLLQELRDHVRPGRRLVDDALGVEHLVAHVMNYEEKLAWIKITVDLNGTEEYILDPLTPTGAVFAKRLRERVAGLSREEAIRVTRNLTEVDRVSISQWPPWNRQLPRIPSHIQVTAEKR